uniref:AAA+ ATPase domain-containing protein n=1 Tax=viral metagenome TaxID=1070528 RepID=A0A6C0JDZ4_9ZZZZ
MSLKIHSNIQKKLDLFRKNNNIPNIIFHGPSGSGKRTIVSNFIKAIYNDNKELLRSYVLFANCAHGKGIKFVREELKFFSKSNITSSNITFKTVILSNADSLTIDAQSALRRCIELFSHNTRFFIIVEDKYKLLRPILSRFSEIYVSLPKIKNKKINLHRKILDNQFGKCNDTKKAVMWIKKYIPKKQNYKKIFEFSLKMYEHGFCGLDFMAYIESCKNIDDITKYHMLMLFNKVKRDFRNEKLYILFMLNNYFLRSNDNITNVVNM